MRSAPNFGDLLLDRRPSHFVPPEMRERRLLALPSASGSGPVSFASLVNTPTINPAVHRTRWSKCQAVASSSLIQGVVSGDNHRRVVTALLLSLHCLGGQS